MTYTFQDIIEIIFQYTEDKILLKSIKKIAKYELIVMDKQNISFIFNRSILKKIE